MVKPGKTRRKGHVNGDVSVRSPQEENQGGGPRKNREGGTRPAPDTCPTQDPGQPQGEPRQGGREEGHHGTLEARTRQARAHTHHINIPKLKPSET